MCLSGGGRVRKREKSNHHVFLIKMVTLWKNNAERAYFGLWQRKGQKALLMACITELTWATA
jgi:hypothetical protein